MIKNIFFVSMAFLLVSVFTTSCKPKDADIQKQVEEALKTVNITQLNVNVAKGIVSISGQAKDEIAKSSWEESIKGLKGVKSIINQLEVAAPVIITANDPLKAGLDLLLKAFGTVKGEVLDGVINLSGSIKRDDWKGLMPKLQELRPKKVVSTNLTIN